VARLAELTSQADPEFANISGARPLTTENGDDQLSPYFKSVGCTPYEDGLDITEHDPLVDYVRSADSVSEDGLSRF
tara:strand:+ start:777 stop:1004 length:228 start_codon:yes stop_codon:yes gene_type:complete